MKGCRQSDRDTAQISIPSQTVRDTPACRKKPCVWKGEEEGGEGRAAGGGGGLVREWYIGVP